ncbi:MAG TPA: outer membrane beta-barrel family protein [Chitinophagaceae bacterium]
METHRFLIVAISVVQVCFPASLFAQAVIQGRVNNHSYKPLDGCNVLLLKPADSLLIRGTTSNHNGSFELTGVKTGNYLLVFSFSGYNKNYTAVEVSGSQKKDLGDIILAPASAELKQVMVTAYKPLLEQKPDRMIVNVKNSITNTGGTVLDVLEKSPGILVNRQESTISMSGKDGVQVMINGKLSYMNAAALVAMLQGMSANNVEKIELITTPPAKYDAGGNAGYINIVLQQNPQEGFTANIALTMAAFYGTIPSANFDFNYRKKKSNLYGGYGFSRRSQNVQRNSYRSIDLHNEFLETHSSIAPYVTRPAHNLRLGFDYEWSKKTTIGFLVSGFINTYKEKGQTRSVMSTNGAIDTTILIDMHEKNPLKHAMTNIYLQHRPDKMSEISFNLDLLLYNNTDPVTYTNKYFNSSNEFVYQNELTSSQNTDFRIFPAQIDYKRKINDKISIETGLKTVASRFTNRVLVARLQALGWEPDPDHTAEYELKEEIKAAYISSTILINKKNTLQAGLRYEYTDANLGSKDQKDIVNRHYGKLFPSIYWSHKIGNSGFNISFSRRITRPAFNQLAPFLYFSDPTTVVTGNPALQPAISNALNVDYLLKQFVISVSYTHESDYNRGFLPFVDTAAQKQFNIPRNITYLKTINARVTLPVTITSWWSSVVNLNNTWQKSYAEGYIGAALERKAARFSISGSEIFRFAKRYSIEVSGLYVSKGLALNGVGIRKPYGNLNIAAQRKFRNPGTALTIGVDDIFSTMTLRSITDIPEGNFHTWVNLQFQRRIFKITFTHRFGNTSMKDRKNRATASEDERKRMSSQ